MTKINCKMQKKNYISKNPIIQIGMLLQNNALDVESGVGSRPNGRASGCPGVRWPCTSKGIYFF
jgi:hypothetical protein